MYMSKPQMGGEFAAYLTTGLRGAELEKNLAAELRALCKQAPLLDHYRFAVFADERSARASLASRNKFPDMSSPEFIARQRAILGFYEPATGVLKIRRANTTQPDEWSTLKLGNEWCKGR